MLYNPGLDFELPSELNLIPFNVRDGIFGRAKKYIAIELKKTNYQPDRLRRLHSEMRLLSIFQVVVGVEMNVQVLA